MGKINISEDAIASIVSVVAKLEHGIVLMSAGTMDRLIKHMSRKKMHKGISVTSSNSRLIIELKIVVPYGARIQHVSRELQINVFKKVNEITGFSPDEIHVRVEGMTIPQG